MDLEREGDEMTLAIIAGVVVGWIACGALSFHLGMKYFSTDGPVTKGTVRFCIVMSLLGPIYLIDIVFALWVEQLDDGVSPFWSRIYPHGKDDTK